MDAQACFAWRARTGPKQHHGRGRPDAGQHAPPDALGHHARPGQHGRPVPHLTAGMTKMSGMGALTSLKNLQAHGA
jgi:hypothetical protein